MAHFPKGPRPPIDLRDYIPPSELAQVQDEMLTEIQTKFTEAVERLQSNNIDAVWDTHVNRDGSIDAELRIRTIPRFKSFSQVVTQFENSIEPIDNTWVSSGVLFSPKYDDNPYDKLEGYNRATAYYQPSEKYHYNLATTRKIVTELRKAERGSVQQLIYRIHWNAMAQKPDRNQGD